MRGARGLAIAWLVGCSSVQPRTEVVVHVEAGPSVAMEATLLHVLVRAGPSRSVDGLVVELDEDQPLGARGFPFEIGLVPASGDASRFFEVTATARRADGTDIVSTRLTSGYVAGMTLLAVVRLEDACRGVICAAELSCHMAECNSAFVEPATELPFVQMPTAQATLLPSDGAAGDQFGSSVSLSADGMRALVGAVLDDTAGGTDSGSAHVFVRTGGRWTEEAALVPSDVEAGDAFGVSVALSADGSWALVGANTDDTAGGMDAGRAHVFERVGTTWTQQATLLASGGAAGDYFGASVALSSDGARALVGAYGDRLAGTNAGSARVFVRTGTTWTEEAALLASDGAADDWLGASVALNSDGSRALVGALYDDTARGMDAGSAHVFARSGTTWTEEATLLAARGAAGDHFGWAVALSADGSRALVGAAWEDSVGTAAGSARLFLRTRTTWAGEVTLLAAAGSGYDYFGWSVALSSEGDRALVGALLDETPGSPSVGGSVRVFRRVGTTWTEEATLSTGGGGSEKHFGFSLALSADGREALVSVNLDDNARGIDSGSATVFTLPP